MTTMMEIIESSLRESMNSLARTITQDFQVYHQIALLVIVILLFWKLVTSKVSLRLPPSPPAIPIIGHLHLLGTHAHIALAKLAEKYGPLMSLRFGQKLYIIASSPKTAKEILKTQDANFSNRPSMAQNHIMLYKHEDVAWGNNTPEWRNLRKIFTLELVGAHRIDAARHVREEEVSDMLQSISRSMGTKIQLTTHLSNMAQNIISRMVMNKRLMESMDNKMDKVEIEDAKNMRHLVAEHFMLAGVFNLGDFIPVLRPFDLQGYERRMRKVKDLQDEFVGKIISEHRERKKSRCAEDNYKMDMVDVLLEHMETKDGIRIMEDNVKGIILAMACAHQNAFLAGTETLIGSVEWAMAELLQNPSFMTQAQAELDAAVGRHQRVHESHLDRLTFLKAIVKEAWRLHPPAPLLIPHMAGQACKVAGYDIPANARVLVNVWAIARDPNLWDDPLVFNPGRFLVEGKYSSRDIRGQDFELLPFGSGRRQCPAMNMGVLEVEFVLASLLHAFQWSLPDDRAHPKDMDMSENFGLTCMLATPLEVMTKPRLAPHLYNMLNGGK